MKVKHFSRAMIFIASIGAVSTIAASNKFQVFASSKYADTQVKQTLFSQQNLEVETEIIATALAKTRSAGTPITSLR